MATPVAQAMQRQSGSWKQTAQQAVPETANPVPASIVE
jgi:hypothetical protein